MPLQVFAQSITGIWIGYLQTADNTLPFELAISGGGKEDFSGYSHTTFTFNGIDNIGVKTIKLKNKKGNVSLEDGELVYSNYTTPPKRVRLFGKLFLKTSDSLMVLSGSFFTRTIDFRAEPTSFVGTVYLRKQKGFPQTKLITQLNQMELLHTLSFAPDEFKKKEEPAIASVSPAPKKKETVSRSATVKKEERPEVTDATNKSSTTVAKESETKIKKKEKQKEKEKEKKKEKEKEKEIIAKKPEQKKPEIVREAEQKTSVVTIKDKKAEPLQPIAAAVAIAQRKTEIIRNVFFTSDSLVLSLYDNGTVDGDTVSVVLNGEVIIAKKGLSENAIHTTIKLSPAMGDSLQLIMYAENLGAIPPNTGVLIIQDGTTRNEIRFAGDLQKSSGIILRRRRAF